MMYKLIILQFLLAMAVLTNAQGKPATEQEEEKLDEIKPPGSNPNYNTQELQYEIKKDDEIEGDALMDLQCDEEIGSELNRPTSKPTQEQLTNLYNNQKERLHTEAMSDLSTVSLNPAIQFYTLEYWQQYQYRCCPRSWNYQCRSSSILMPCFNAYFWGVREWCCPIWPNQVWVRRCECSQCAVLTATCAHEGRCRRRYSKRSFLAACYRGNGWAYLRYITRYLPSSCYCNINRHCW